MEVFKIQGYYLIFWTWNGTTYYIYWFEIISEREFKSLGIFGRNKIQTRSTGITDLPPTG